MISGVWSIVKHFVRKSDMNSICYCQYFGCFITCCVREGALICHVFRRGHFTQDVSESFCIHKKKKKKKKRQYTLLFLLTHTPIHWVKTWSRRLFNVILQNRLCSCQQWQAKVHSLLNVTLQHSRNSRRLRFTMNWNWKPTRKWTSQHIT